MPHPIMFRDDDPGLAELRAIALDFPEAFEKVSHGRPVFCVPKMYAVYGGSCNTITPGEMTPFPHSVLVKADENDRTALEQDRRFFFPAYMGPYGFARSRLHRSEGGLGRGQRIGRRLIPARRTTQGTQAARRALDHATRRNLPGNASPKLSGVVPISAPTRADSAQGSLGSLLSAVL